MCGLTAYIQIQLFTLMRLQPPTTYTARDFSKTNIFIFKQTLRATTWQSTSATNLHILTRYNYYLSLLCYLRGGWRMDAVVLLPDVSMRTGEGADKPPLLLLLFCGRMRHSNRFGAGFASTYGQRFEYFYEGQS